MHESWNERTEMMASFIRPGSRVIEFGAGYMHMKTLLDPTCTYTPSDLVKRYDETIVCDLNQQIDFDLNRYDVAVFSGVLEYVFDVDAVIRQLSSAGVRQVLLSYCPTDVISENRVKHGWMSDLSRAQLERIFSKYSYEVVHHNEWKQQCIYDLTLTGTKA